MNLNLKNKKVLVTGSSHGIGLEIAKCLSNEGCMVAINGRNKRKLFKASKLISGSFPIQGDVTNYKIDAVKKTEYEGSDDSIYLDEIKGISSKQIEILSKVEIHTTLDFLNVNKKDITGLKGMGNKTYEKNIVNGITIPIYPAIVENIV